MCKRFIFVTVIVFILFIGISCMAEDESITNTTTPSPGLPAPLFHIDGRIYGLYGRWGGASNLFDDTYVYIGTIPSYAYLFQNVTDNFQSNDPHLVGAKLYQSDENIILVSNGVYSLHRFIGEELDCWINKK